MHDCASSSADADSTLRTGTGGGLALSEGEVKLLMKLLSGTVDGLIESGGPNVRVDWHMLWHVGIVFVVLIVLFSAITVWLSEIVCGMITVWHLHYVSVVSSVVVSLSNCPCVLHNLQVVTSEVFVEAFMARYLKQLPSTS